MSIKNTLQMLPMWGLFLVAAALNVLYLPWMFLRRNLFTILAFAALIAVCVWACLH